MINTIDGRDDPKPNADHDPVESGKKAIEADRLINKKDLSKEEQERQESQDAEQWRNEG